jgi:hypothetical protein
MNARAEAFPEELEVFGSVVDIEDFELETKALMKSDLKALGRQARSYVGKYYTWEKFGRSIVECLKGWLIEPVMHAECSSFKT